jgi:hypothetical protein
MDGLQNPRLSDAVLQISAGNVAICDTKKQCYFFLTLCKSFAILSGIWFGLSDPLT